MWLDLCCYCVLGLSMDMSCFNDMGQGAFSQDEKCENCFFPRTSVKTASTLSDTTKVLSLFFFTLSALCPFNIFPKKVGRCPNTFCTLNMSCDVMSCHASINLGFRQSVRERFERVVASCFAWARWPPTVLLLLVNSWGSGLRHPTA